MSESLVPRDHAEAVALFAPRSSARSHAASWIRLEIIALTPDNTAEYLRMRLARAGCKREVFASDDVVVLHKATLGAMRDLDRLATACGARCEPQTKSISSMRRPMTSRARDRPVRA